MTGRKFVLSGLIMLFTASLTFGQTEVFKNVVNNLAFYKAKKDLKYLAAAKKSVDSLITNKADSADLEKNVYKAVVYSSIAYIDSLNKLAMPATFFDQTCKNVDKLSTYRKVYKYQPEMDYAKRCLANVYLRRGFAFVNISDYSNAIVQFNKAKIYDPAFKETDAYIAYANNKLGNLQDAARFYDNLLKTDSTRAEYIETASNIYKSIGDTSKALQILQKGRRLLPLDKGLLTDEANIYNNQNNYKALEPLLPPLLDAYPNSGDVAFIAANCYDHTGEFDKAESLYLRSAELNSTSYDPVYNLGVLYLRFGVAKKGDDGSKNIARATQWLEKANEISPDDVKCLQLLQFVYAQKGDADKVDKIKTKLKLLSN